jgi:hypothetical protein
MPMYIWDEYRPDRGEDRLTFLSGCRATSEETRPGSRTPVRCALDSRMFMHSRADQGEAFKVRGAHVAQHIALVISGQCPGVSVKHVRTGVAPSGEAGEVDLAVRYLPEQWNALQTCLEGLDCGRQARDPEGRLVQFGVLRYEGRDFFVHVYMIER